MPQTIEIGTLLIRKGTPLPETLPIESDPYLNGWRRVKNLDKSGLDRKLCEAGWSFFYMAREVDAIVLGPESDKTIRRAVKHVIANMKSEKFNCLEISDVSAKRFLGLPYLTVAVHPRHIQESVCLFHAKRISEWQQAKLAAI